MFLSRVLDPRLEETYSRWRSFLDLYFCFRSIICSVIPCCYWIIRLSLCDSNQQLAALAGTHGSASGSPAGAPFSPAGPTPFSSPDTSFPQDLTASGVLSAAQQLLPQPGGRPMYPAMRGDPWLQDFPCAAPIGSLAPAADSLGVKSAIKLLWSLSFESGEATSWFYTRCWWLVPYVSFKYSFVENGCVLLLLQPGSVLLPRCFPGWWARGGRTLWMVVFRVAMPLMVLSRPLLCRHESVNLFDHISPSHLPLVLGMRTLAWMVPLRQHAAALIVEFPLLLATFTTYALRTNPTTPLHTPHPHTPPPHFGANPATPLNNTARPGALPFSTPAGPPFLASPLPPLNQHPAAAAAAAAAATAAGGGSHRLVHYVLGSMLSSVLSLLVCVLESQVLWCLARGSTLAREGRHSIWGAMTTLVAGAKGVVTQVGPQFISMDGLVFGACLAALVMYEDWRWLPTPSWCAAHARLDGAADTAVLRR